MSVSIKIDEYYTFKLVSSNDIIGNSVNWNSSNTSIASIDSQGKVKGLKAGTLIEIDGATFNIDTTDDGIHSNVYFI